MSTGSRSAASLVLLVFLAAHVPFLGPDIEGCHKYRQADTAAVARNFVRESANPLLPRIDARGDLTGIAAMEFPLYPWATAWIVRATGLQVVVAAKLLSLLAAAAAFLLTARLCAREASLDPFPVTAVLFAVPIFFLYATMVMPEVAGLALTLLGVERYFAWHRSGGTTRAILAILGLGLGILVRPYFVFWGLPILIHAVWGLRGPWRDTAARVALGAIVLAPFALWYFVWCPHLTATYGSTHFFRGAAGSAALADPATWGRLAYVIAQDYLGWGLLLWVVLGLPRAPRGIGIAMPVLTVVGLVAVAGTAFDKHPYYLFGLVPVAALLGGLGVAFVLRRRPRWLPIVLVLLLVGLAGRVGHHYASTPREGLPDALRAEVAARTAPDDLFAVRSTDHGSWILWTIDRHGWLVEPDRLADRDWMRDLRDRGADWVLDRVDGSWVLYATSPGRDELGPYSAK